MRNVLGEASALQANQPVVSPEVKPEVIKINVSIASELTSDPREED